MKVRSAGVLLAALLGAPSFACSAHPKKPLEIPGSVGTLRDLDDFEAAYNRYVLLDDGDPRRARYREQLLDFLVGYTAEQLSDKEEDEALSALEHAVALYRPSELRAAKVQPQLAKQARALYRSVARRGAERPALFALAIEQQFGEPAQRDRALRDWKILKSWVARNSEHSTDPLLGSEELERSLEQVAATLPSEFVTTQLVGLYLGRYRAAAKTRAKGGALGTGLHQRMDITGYLVMRAYLRADDIARAISSTAELQLAKPIAGLRQALIEVQSSKRSALPILALAEHFVPEDGIDPEQPMAIQGWGIVANLARRAVKRFPNDAYVHLLRARSFAHSGLDDAAVVHLERCIDLKEDIFEAWQGLAQLQQRRLDSLAVRDPEAAAKRLQELERFHKRAVELWSDRPIEPGLPLAFFTVGEAHYQAGNVDAAIRLLERSLKIEAAPRSLDLLGTIAFKRNELKQATARYRDLANLPYEDDIDQLHWEARARVRLGEIALRQGDKNRFTNHVNAALHNASDLLVRGSADPDDRAELHLERGRMFFLLGDTRQAMDDFRQAQALAPDNPRTYADPLRMVVSHGFYVEAHQMFERAMSQQRLPDGLKLYFSLWMNELALRQSQQPDTTATAFLDRYRATPWGVELAKHARGELAFDKLFARASDRGEKAEAYFYEGLRQWRLGDRQRAKALMQSVINTQMMDFAEYDMAQSYLEWGELPQTARAPMALSHTR